LTRRASCLALERVLVVGDAAGYVEPFTGEGIAWAIESAIALAPVAHRAVCQWQPSLGLEWARIHYNTIARRQVICRVMSRMLRHPVLCGMFVHILSQAPSMAAPLIRRVHTPCRRRTTR
jgi:flavin-dependent dehydrogenase